MFNVLWCDGGGWVYMYLVVFVELYFSLSMCIGLVYDDVIVYGVYFVFEVIDYYMCWYVCCVY